MNTDIRLSLSIRSHPKTKKLKFMLRNDGVLSFIWLLMFAAESRPDGSFTGLDDVDIAMAANWEGDPAEFTKTLTDIGFLEQSENGYRIHDWAQHNPWAANAARRSVHARKAASARWSAKYGKSEPETENQGVKEENYASGIDEQCGKHEGAMRGALLSNAPTPIPKPKTTKHGSSAAHTDHHGYSPEFEKVWAAYPNRNGSDPKKPAYSAYRQRLNEGVSPENIIEGVQRYAAWIHATDKAGTETVMQAKRFFGPGLEWENDWQPPVKPLKLPRDNHTLWKIRRALGINFEYVDLTACHNEIHKHLNQNPEKRSLIEDLL